jgi:hypothetical protein
MTYGQDFRNGKTLRHRWRGCPMAGSGQGPGSRRDGLTLRPGQPRRRFAHYCAPFTWADWPGSCIQAGKPVQD